MEFVERPHYPVAMMVDAAELLYQDMLIEIEMEAEIPEDDWGTEITADDQ
jgi:enamine deaminase RidA (YjgF/YER057c/UK114 family)